MTRIRWFSQVLENIKKKRDGGGGIRKRRKTERGGLREERCD
jgi:hypothetical protein